MCFDILLTEADGMRHTIRMTDFGYAGNQPVRRAVREQSFVPASRQGRVVRQVVQIPFDFIPDSTARRSR